MSTVAYKGPNFRHHDYRRSGRTPDTEAMTRDADSVDPDRAVVGGVLRRAEYDALGDLSPDEAYAVAVYGTRDEDRTPRVGSARPRPVSPDQTPR